jgi:hypothetical protein
MAQSSDSVHCRYGDIGTVIEEESCDILVAVFKRADQWCTPIYPSGSDSHTTVKKKLGYVLMTQ